MHVTTSRKGIAPAPYTEAPGADGSRAFAVRKWHADGTPAERATIALELRDDACHVASVLYLNATEARELAELLEQLAGRAETLEKPQATR